VVRGVGAPGALAENEPRVGLSMESKMQGNRKKLEDLGGQGWLGHQARSQKMRLEWASVWRAKCKEFHRKMKDLGGQGGWGTRRARRK